MDVPGKLQSLLFFVVGEFLECLFFDIRRSSSVASRHAYPVTLRRACFRGPSGRVGVVHGMSRSAEDDAGGLGALLGGYGSDSAEPAETAPAVPAVPASTGTDAGPRGDTQQSPARAVTQANETVPDGLDREPSGPAPCPELYEQTVRTSPSPTAAPSSGFDEGHRFDEDEPVAGPARPAPGDTANAYAAYPERPDEELREDQGEERVVSGRQGEKRDTQALGGPSTSTANTSKTIQTTPLRLKHSAPECFLTHASRVPEAKPDTSPCSASMTAKMQKWLSLKRDGVDVNDALRKSKGFRNPDFLRSAVRHFGIDERATHFSRDVFDPKAYAKEDYYDTLASAQKRIAEKREQDRKTQGPSRVVEFRTAAGERAAAAAVAAAEAVTRRKRERDLR